MLQYKSDKNLLPISLVNLFSMSACQHREAVSAIHMTLTVNHTCAAVCKSVCIRRIPSTMLLWGNFISIVWFVANSFLSVSWGAKYTHSLYIKAFTPTTTGGLLLNVDCLAKLGFGLFHPATQQFLSVFSGSTVSNTESCLFKHFVVLNFNNHC